MTTVTSTTSRFGDPIWVVQWGKGLTEMVICLTKAEADEVAVTRQRPSTGLIQPLVQFR